MFREKLGITQRKLAEATEVSTNMITQIETGRANPSVEKYVKIFNHLFKKSDEKEKLLGEICASPIRSIRPTQTAQDAKEILDNKKLDIDCLPVIDKDGHLCGKITKEGLDDLFKKTRRNADSIIIKDILEESPPTAPYDIPKKWIRDLLQIRENCILVTKNSKLTGFVNYWDYLYK